MASSSSSSPFFSSGVPISEHDVFLSFRGEDTRHNFTGHLYTALIHKAIKAYIDDKGLERGDEISRSLKEAIERSKISIIVFSRDYASSSWCLEELVHILRCRERNNQIIVPVFYHVDPSDVRKQKGSYGTAFEEHKDHIARKGKVDQWRDALTTVSNLSGWDSQVIRSEPELVEKIVGDILKKLNRISSTNSPFSGLVGIDERINKIEYLLRVGSSDTLVVGIWGPGGIGKTTLAQLVFDRLSFRFESCCFLPNIRKEWDQGQKKYELKKKLFSILLKEENPNMASLYIGSTFDEKRLCNKRVLIVLDDVDDSEELEFLAGDHGWFGLGSRIIVTTRDMQVLRNEVDEIYKVEKLDFEESLVLFNSKAFKKFPSTNESAQLVEKIVNYAEGVPLALKVLSSFLCGKRQENWEAELKKLKECPNRKILNILRTSYDGLDEMQKCIFLDIACFSKDMFRDDVERILDACGLYASVGVDDLIDKSLISIKVDNKIWMHDLIQQMAWDIVKSAEDVQRYSRLWIPQDACHVLETNIGTEATQGILLDMSKINKIYFNPVAFLRMRKLRLLKIFHSDRRSKCEVSIHRQKSDLRFLPNSLRYLYWEGYPWKSFPTCFRPENLVELHLPHSNVERLWEGNQPLRSLKKIDLNHSKNLIELPDLSQALHLKHIYLENCTSLCQVTSSIKHLGELKTLILDGCSSLHNFPKLPKNIVCLILSGTAIEKVPQSIQYLDSLEILYLSGCVKLVNLPGFLMMKSLKAIKSPPAITSTPWWFYRVYKRHNGQIPKFYDVGLQSSIVDQDWPEHPDSNLPVEPPHFCSPWPSHSDALDVMMSNIPSQHKSRYIKHQIRERSKKDSLPELPLMCCDDNGFEVSIGTVSISRTAIAQYLNGHDQARNLLFFNCLGFYDEGNSFRTVDKRLKVLSRNLALREFSREFPTEADVGVCCSRDEIPKWFHSQANEDTVYAFFGKNAFLGNLPDTNILGFALCAIVDFTHPLNISENELYLLCEPRYKTTNFDKMEWDGSFPGRIESRPGHMTRSSENTISSASFRFWLGCAEDRNAEKIRRVEFAKVTKCAVHVLYAKQLVSGSDDEEGEDSGSEEFDYMPLSQRLNDQVKSLPSASKGKEKMVDPRTN